MSFKAFGGQAATAQPATESFFDRLGFPRPLIWGFVGLTLFTIGNGVETNILTPFLTGDHGFSIPLAGSVVTVYGVAVALAASNTVLIFITYGIRGLDYPFFANGFPVWISATA